MSLKLLKLIFYKLKAAVFDLLPIIIVVTFFQVVILRQPFPDLAEIIIGLVFVVIGMTLFIEGLKIGLFPIGENLSYSLTKKGSLFWLLCFSFLLGFSTTIAEPALIAVTKEAARIASEGDILPHEKQNIYAMGLRLSVALSVGFAILIGVLRIIKGWPIYYFIIGGYALVMLITIFAPPEIIGIAFDAGGVTTSTITVPLVTALGVGLASIIKGRSPLSDGFGLIALASLLPMIFVMVYGILIFKT